MIDPAVDVVIPVHTADRPIGRAVGSVLDGTAAPVRVSVVCHNVEVDDIARVLGRPADDPRVRLLRLVDGIPSPAGPINAGLDAATAPFTALLDSDDTYEPGAVDAWLAVQRRDRADAVIPMFRSPDGRSTRTPPTRPFRSRRLDGVKDRLAYRTRLHGLLSRSRFGELRMTPGLRSGEDVIQGAAVWYSGARISFARGAPGYRIHVDGGQRTSAAPKPAAESFAFLDAVLEGAWFDGLSPAQRDAFGVKLLRTHLMDILRDALPQGPAELGVVGEAARRIRGRAPGAFRVLSRRDARIVETVAAEHPDAASLAADLAVRTDFRRPSNLVTTDPRALLAREAPLRLLTAIALSP